MTENSIELLKNNSRTLMSNQNYGNEKSGCQLYTLLEFDNV